MVKSEATAYHYVSFSGGGGGGGDDDDVLAQGSKKLRNGPVVQKSLAEVRLTESARICCDACDVWVHAECANVSISEDLEDFDNYYPECAVEESIVEKSEPKYRILGRL
ncbi:histone-lysine N-methyltransferase ATX3 isoform X1 [Tanacetum coccineum]